jgi:hypothetical protein
MMNPGDWITIHMHDTPAGFRVDMTDETTHESGSMTASIDNGFAHILFRPDAMKCTSAPYAFHPEYSTASPRGNTWSAHTYNVSFSDEIGHFEHCNELDENFNCAVPGSDDETLDDDDVFCVPAADSLLVHINGCFAADLDFDGPSYQNDWPGTNPNVKTDQRLHPEPVIFTSPTTNGGHAFPTIAFEADMPAFEGSCDTTTGEGCVNPPPGAQFYPFYSTRKADGGGCAWQEGGKYIPGTTNDFGGSSVTEYGTTLLPQVFPDPGFTTDTSFENFNSGDIPNPCTG